MREQLFQRIAGKTGPVTHDDDVARLVANRHVQRSGDEVHCHNAHVWKGIDVIGRCTRSFVLLGFGLRYPFCSVHVWARLFFLVKSFARLHCIHGAGGKSLYCYARPPLRLASATSLQDTLYTNVWTSGYWVFGMEMGSPAGHPDRCVTVLYIMERSWY